MVQISNSERDMLISAIKTVTDGMPLPYTVSTRVINAARMLRNLRSKLIQGKKRETIIRHAAQYADMLLNPPQQDNGKKAVAQAPG